MLFDGLLDEATVQDPVFLLHRLHAISEYKSLRGKAKGDASDPWMLSGDRLIVCLLSCGSIVVLPKYLSSTI